MGAPWANRVVRRAHKGVSESRTWSRTRFWEIGRESPKWSPGVVPSMQKARGPSGPRALRSGRYRT